MVTVDTSSPVNQAPRNSNPSSPHLEEIEKPNPLTFMKDQEALIIQL